MTRCVVRLLPDLVGKFDLREYLAHRAGVHVIDIGRDAALADMTDRARAILERYGKKICTVESP